MIQLGIAILLLLAILYFVNGFTRQKRLSSKEQELEEAELDSDILDIDKSIAEERAHQREMEKDINNIKGK
ncbi:MAG: hypothetical protein COA95_02190 [Methylophaga sp.]|nr:MAG: hypothetical protein COA95_02190 [Methylophaga sp.]